MAYKMAEKCSKNSSEKFSTEVIFDFLTLDIVILNKLEAT